VWLLGACLQACIVCCVLRSLSTGVSCAQGVGGSWWTRSHPVSLVIGANGGVHVLVWPQVT
jgi:hypothetical protein